MSALIADNTLKKLERDIAELKRQKSQGLLFDGQSALDEMDRSIEMKEEERKRREFHYEEVREQLAKERDRIINRMLPRRYALHGEAQVFPLAIEIRFPAAPFSPASGEKVAVRPSKSSFSPALGEKVAVRPDEGEFAS